ncbi:hypothetical protein ES319_D12G233900v1 [Gossypium barbadense]|uniref:C3H1-type domain-containing protein n=1 Tax=Gossypium barbadense TaxID=3634 RepID=A0A5J5P1G5_GOSBA|nr:hypothetical protein ES319_D12G233900v1 [Gossypium barbadense]
MGYSRDNVVHVIPNPIDPSVWATEEDYRAWNSEETFNDTLSNFSYDQRQPQSWSNSDMPPNKKSRNSQDLNSRSKAIGKMFFKTKLCCKFRAGTCPYIKNCNFAHSIEELRRPPPNWQEIVAAHEEEKGILAEPREEFHIPSLGSNSFSGETQRSYKGRHCKKFYTEEGCPYGDNCTFLLDEQSKNRESVAISLGPGGYGGGGGGGGGAASGGCGSGSNVKPSNWKTRICNKWELTGYCPFGNKCHFAHGVAGSEEGLHSPHLGNGGLLTVQYFAKHDTVKLADHNFLLWKHQLLLILEGYGLEGFVLGTVSAPPAEIAGVDGQMLHNSAFLVYRK